MTVVRTADSNSTVHGAHPTVERYSLCAITHEGDTPVKLAGPGERINCPNCRVVINACHVMRSDADTRPICLHCGLINGFHQEWCSHLKAKP